MRSKNSCLALALAVILTATGCSGVTTSSGTTATSGVSTDNSSNKPSTSTDNSATGDDKSSLKGTIESYMKSKYNRDFVAYGQSTDDNGNTLIGMYYANDETLGCAVGLDSSNNILYDTYAQRVAARWVENAVNNAFGSRGIISDCYCVLENYSDATAEKNVEGTLETHLSSLDGTQSCAISLIVKDTGDITGDALRECYDIAAKSLPGFKVILFETVLLPDAYYSSVSKGVKSAYFAPYSGDLFQHAGITDESTALEVMKDWRYVEYRKVVGGAEVEQNYNVNDAAFNDMIAGKISDFGLANLGRRTASDLSEVYSSGASIQDIADALAESESNSDTESSSDDDYTTFTPDDSEASSLVGDNSVLDVAYDKLGYEATSNIAMAVRSVSAMTAFDWNVVKEEVSAHREDDSTYTVADEITVYLPDDNSSVAFFIYDYVDGDGLTSLEKEEILKAFALSAFPDTDWRWMTYKDYDLIVNVSGFADKALNEIKEHTDIDSGLRSDIACALIWDINGITVLTAGVSDESNFSALKTLSNIASQAGYSLGVVM